MNNLKIGILYTVAIAKKERIYFLNHFKKLLPTAEIALYLIHKKTAYAQVSQIIARENFDLLFNFCDGALFSSVPGIEVVKLLEEKNIAFTGADSHFFDPTRLAMKMACHSVGVKTPASYWMDTKEIDLSEILKTLTFPMIVKPPQGYGSEGLTKNALVENVTALKKQIKKIFYRFGAVLIEEFILGQEFTVLVLENPEGKDPFVFTPLEFDLGGSKQFKHHRLKWADYHQIKVKASEALELNAKLKEASKKAFLAMEGNGFARVDIRVNEKGEIFLLELNPNCAIYGWPEACYEAADLILLHDNALSFFTEKLMQLALNRQQKNSKKIKINYHKTRGFSLSANKDILRGEKITNSTNYGEMNNFRLVTKNHTQKYWNKIEKSFFDSYCWPLNQDVFVMWSKNPDEWLPINHSCDPNACISGLDFIARKSIAKGELITIDYLTFCADDMRKFNCECGENKCRKIIEGYSENMKEFITKTYGEFVSPYIASLIQQC